MIIVTPHRESEALESTQGKTDDTLSGRVDNILRIVVLGGRKIIGTRSDVVYVTPIGHAEVGRCIWG